MQKSAPPLFRTHDLAFRTQYAELKERALQIPHLLPGTPGTLVRREGSGAGYAYRAYYPVPGSKQKEALVCRWDDEAGRTTARDEIEFAGWMEKQTSLLRKIGFQVADKKTARVLVELHNRGLFAAGLVLVGTLAYTAWLNELGAIAIAARTLDVDLARRGPLKLASPQAFLDTMRATDLPFVPVPGMPSSEPSTTVKLPGVEGLRVDILAPGKQLGKIVQARELAWAALQIPFYDYLLEFPVQAALLAGGHCVPVLIPQAGRFACHKLFSAADTQRSPEKAEKDLRQAAVLVAAQTDADQQELLSAFDALPKGMRKAVRASGKKLQGMLTGHEEAAELITQLATV